jgi:PHP domain
MTRLTPSPTRTTRPTRATRPTRTTRATRATRATRRLTQLAALSGALLCVAALVRAEATLAEGDGLPDAQQSASRDPRNDGGALSLLAKKYADPVPFQLAGRTYHPYAFEGHVHSHHSRDADHPVPMILEAAETLGLDAIVITDHGSTRSRHDFAKYRGTVVPFVGEEFGGEYGHAVTWNVPTNDDHESKGKPLNERAAFAHQHGGLLVFAHPGWWINGNSRDPMQWMTPANMRRGGLAGEIDAIELWNGVYRTPLPKLIDAWVAMLDAHVFVPIVGNSDFHRFRSHLIGSARSVAYCEHADLRTCLWPATRAGRLYVTDGPTLIFSVNDQLPGATLTPAPGDELVIRVEAFAPEGGELRLYVGRKMAGVIPLSPNVRMKTGWRLPAPAHDSFVRIDIKRAHKARGQTHVSLLSNPVLLDVAPTAAWR